jgi:hypothetical protein
MHYVILGALALGVLVGVGQLFVRLDARQLVQLGRYVIGGLMVAGGIVFIVGGRWGLGIALAGLGAGLLMRGRIGGIDFGGGTKSPGRRSSVRSRHLEMELDHDTGDLTGSVKSGPLAGTRLDALDLQALRELRAEVGDDADSVQLLDVYLDRRFPGWREDAEGDGAAGAGSPADARAMTDEEAYEILGLAPGADPAEVRAAHRRLMKGVHPDQGGSTFLAAKINQAKDRLLGKHR